MGEIGNALREARVRRGLTIDQASQETRISARFLEALEAEEFEVLPAPVYVRGFIRSYSNYLQIDPQPLLAQLNLGGPAAAGAAGNEFPQMRPAPPRPGTRDPWRPQAVPPEEPFAGEIGEIEPEDTATAGTTEAAAWQPEQPEAWEPEASEAGETDWDERDEEPVLLPRRPVGILIEDEGTGDGGGNRRGLVAAVIGGIVLIVVAVGAVFALSGGDDDDQQAAANVTPTAAPTRTRTVFVAGGTATPRATPSPSAVASPSPGTTAAASPSPAATTPAAVPATPTPTRPAQNPTPRPAPPTPTPTETPTPEPTPTQVPTPTPVPPTPTPTPIVHPVGLADCQTGGSGGVDCGDAPHRIVCGPLGWFVDDLRNGRFPLGPGMKEGIAATLGDRMQVGRGLGCSSP